MRGIHINNYIDNRIVLSGKKLKNQVQAVMHPQKPKPIIIHHLKEQRELKQLKDQPQYIHDEAKTIKNASSKKKRKRNKTIHGRQWQQNYSNDKNRIKVSLEELKANLHSLKKKSSSSSPSKDSDTINMLETQRKLKPIYDDHAPGLGKRSKSAIIKRTKQMKSEEKYKDHKKSSNKKQEQKKKKQKPPNQSRKNLKIKDQIKDKNKQKPQTKQKKSKISQGQKMKKVASDLNILLKQNKKKIGINTAATTSRKTSRPQSKSHIVSSAVSKPNSARGYKKIKGSQIKAQFNRKIFHNQGIEDQLYGNEIETEQRFKNIILNKKPDDVEKIVSQLERALNSVGSRKKIQQELKNLLQKIKDMDSEEEEEDSHVKELQNKEAQNNFNIKLPGNKLHYGEMDDSEEQDEQFLNKQTSARKQDQNTFEIKFPQQSKVAQISENNTSKKSQQESECKNTPQKKEMELIQFDPDQDISQNNQVSIHDHFQNAHVQEMYQRRQLEADTAQLYQYPSNSNKDHQNNELLYRNNLKEQKYIEDNPMLSRRSNNEQLNIMNMNQYDSIKSHQDEKQSEISQLKKFQQESNAMMEKVKKLQKKQQLKIDIRQPETLQSYNQDIDVSNKQVTSLKKEQIALQEKQTIQQKTPKNAEMYGFQRYPTSTILNQLKSPKMSEHNISEIISLKGKVQDSRHDKLSQLVNTLFKNNMVSPKTYDHQIGILNSKYEEQSQRLSNYQKHADELSKILNEIRRQKEQIHGIEQLIKQEKWQEALKLVKKQEQQICDKKVQQTRKRSLTRQVGINHEKLSSESEKSQSQSENQQEIVYYSGEQEEDTSLTNSYHFNNNSDDGFKLIKIRSQGSQHEQQTKQQKNHEQNDKNQKYLNNLKQTHSDDSIIKIDQNEIGEENNQQLPKQRGFESNLFFIKEYCIALCQFIRDSYKQNFKQAIGKPVAYDLEELLRSYRVKKDGTQATRINSLYEELPYHDCQKKAEILPISQSMFDDFNKNYEGIKYFGKETTQDAALQGIFLRSIFNALNQSISIQRPGSIYGRPLPWSHSSKHLKNLKNNHYFDENASKKFSKSSQSEDLIFGIAIARIIQWGSCLCGFIPDTIELENTEIDEEYINHIRQTRMALLLQKMLSEEQQSMSQMQLEQTQVKLSISNIIMSQLAKQFEIELKGIQKKAIIKQIDY